MATQVDAHGHGYAVDVWRNEPVATDWDYWVETGMVAEVERERQAEFDYAMREAEAIDALTSAGLIEHIPLPVRVPVRVPDDGPF